MGLKKFNFSMKFDWLKFLKCGKFIQKFEISLESNKFKFDWLTKVIIACNSIKKNIKFKFNLIC